MRSTVSVVFLVVDVNSGFSVNVLPMCGHMLGPADFTLLLDTPPTPPLWNFAKSCKVNVKSFVKFNNLLPQTSTYTGSFF